MQGLRWCEGGWCCCFAVAVVDDVGNKLQP